MNAYTAVVGLGKTGVACARFLERNGWDVVAMDSRPSLDYPHLGEGVEVRLGALDEGILLGASQVIVSPGVPLEIPPLEKARSRGIPLLGDIELFAHHADAPVVAITGSNGKSTVTAMVGEMARRAGYRPGVGGNFGVPALELLGQGHDLYVLELSSFQLEITESLSPEAAVVLNLSPDHLDRHGTLARYGNIKRRIYRRARSKIVNADDPRVRGMAEGDLCFTLGSPKEATFGILEDGRGSPWLAFEGEPWVEASILPIEGRYNLANALAAMALGKAMGWPKGPMIEALRDFRGLPHRCQRVLEAHGVTWYNDSKGTNVGATLAVLEGFSGKVVLIAGGEGKGADFTPLGEAVARKARAVVLMGRDAQRMEAVMRGVPVARADDMKEAVEMARRFAKPGDSVLLSPACASLDRYPHYAARGEDFIRAVKEAHGQG